MITENITTADELESQRQIQLRLWLTENPQSSETFFNEKIWQHLRANIIRQRLAAAVITK